MRKEVMQPKAARSNHLGASRRSSCPRSFIALPARLDVRLSPARNLATRILLGILMSLCLALSLLLVDIVRRAVVESIKARMIG